MSANAVNLPMKFIIPEKPYQFEMKSGAVIDCSNHAHFSSNGTVDIEIRSTEFQNGAFTLTGGLIFEAKFKEQQFVLGSPNNPSILVAVGDWERSLQRDKMFDHRWNSQLVRYLMHMIAFMSKNRFRKQYLWTNDGAGSNHPRPGKKPELFAVPSDDELITIFDSV